MSAPKEQGLALSLSAEAKRLKLEPRTYSRRRSDKFRTKRSSGSAESIPSPSKSPRGKEKYIGPPTVVLDNGAYAAKVGMSTSSEPTVIPNCIMKVKSERKRFFIGNQIDECRDLSGLYYLLPCEKGYTMKWTVQKPVWDYIFNNICPVEDKPVIMSQPVFNFKAIQEITDEIFFEEYEIKSMFRANPVDLAKYEYLTNVVGKSSPCIIVDSGFSFTTVMPYINGKKYYQAARRINVGGKLLTNYLKDIISYRQLHVMDETYVINQVKEDTCYTSLDFKEDMKIAAHHGDKNTIIKNYVLPDFNTIRRGYVQTPGDNLAVAEGCQILRLNNERFTVPEILFHPSDIGMDSMGVAEAIVKSIKLCPAKDQPLLAKNIVVMGGNACFPGFKERVYADVRSYLPDHWTVSVYKPDDPINFAWKGGKSLSEDPKIKSLLVTKEQYEERGSAYTYERFSDWIHTQKNEENSSNKQSEVQATQSILKSNNFTRFDLFGKYEPENEDVIVIEDETSDSDKTAKESNENKPENSDDIFKESKDETASNLERDPPSETLQDDVGESSNNNKPDKTNTGKNSKTNLVQTNDVAPYSMDILDTYNFNVFDSTFI